MSGHRAGDQHDTDHHHDDQRLGDHETAHGHGEHHDDAGAHAHEHEHEREGLRAALSQLFRTHSHDSGDRIDDAVRGSAAGIRAVKISVLLLGLTAALQLAVVLFSASVALLADTVHNFADASTAIPLWIAFSMGRRQPDRRYSYGYGRAEDLAGVFIVLMITASAAIAAWKSVERLIQPEPISHLEWVAAAAIIGFLGNEAVAQYRIGIGRRIGSAALVADGLHARTDGLTSLAVLFGAAGVWLGFPQADPIVGLLITVAILFVLKDAVVSVGRRLMDAVEPEVLDLAEAACVSCEGVRSVISIRARWVGHNLQADARIAAEPGITLINAHDLAERVRHAMLHAVPKLADVVVHVDPDHDEAHALAEHHQPPAADHRARSARA